MKLNKILPPVLTLFTLFLMNCFVTVPGAAEEQKQAAAIMAAEDFLLLVDTGQYGKSWDAAAALFRRQVPKDAWIQQISAVRPALGAVIRREIISADSMTELPGAPDGEYVVIRYSSSFTGKQNGVETITPMLDEDGQWRVSGYYIK